MGNLTKDFSEWEFRCKCGCGICNVSNEFVQKLQTVRTLAGISFTISSGCRCLEYNRSIDRSKDTSDHVTSKDIQCEGADIQCFDSISRLKIISAAITSGFKRIGIAKSFIHLGMKKDNPQNVLWTY